MAQRLPDVSGAGLVNFSAFCFLRAVALEWTLWLVLRVAPLGAVVNVGIRLLGIL